MTATQPSFNHVLDLAFLLPFSEQQRLIEQVQGNIYDHIQRVEDTPEELKARLRESHRQALAGEVHSEEDARQMMHQYVKLRTSKSA